jgi:recyclin-1
VDTVNGEVAPLTEFFELVHVADVIQQMIQLYYDEEIVSSLPFKAFYYYYSN